MSTKTQKCQKAVADKRKFPIPGLYGYSTESFLRLALPVGPGGKGQPKISPGGPRSSYSEQLCPKTVEAWEKII